MALKRVLPSEVEADVERRVKRMRIAGSPDM